MSDMESLKKNILTECDEDHVGLWSVIRDAEELFPKQDEAAIRERVLKALRELLLAGEIRAGFPTKKGTFRTLNANADTVLSRVQAEWPLGHPPNIGEGLWFTRPTKSGRTLSSYVRKYGTEEGTKMYRRLQREASLASAHAQHKKRLRAKDR
jgi:hypothetical protein